MNEIAKKPKFLTFEEWKNLHPELPTEEEEECEACDGKGEVECPHCGEGNIDCEDCDGQGKITINPSKEEYDLQRRNDEEKWREHEV